MVDQFGSSLLAVDFGSVRTRAVLIDAVDGVYRLVARADSRTTDGFPVNDLMIAFERVTRQLSQTTRRRFTADSGLLIMPEQSDRSGVDHFVLTASIGRPLRAVLVGLIPDVSVASALRAAAGTYIEVAGILSLDDGLSDEERLNIIQTQSPDVILITGGTEQGAQNAVLRQAEAVQMAVALMPEPRRPLVVYAGNSALVDAMHDLFDGVAVLLIAGNVRPALEDEHLDAARSQLARAFDRYKERRHQSLGTIAAMSSGGVRPSAQSHIILAEYLGRLTTGGALVVDVGSSAATLAFSDGRRSVSSIRTDLGLGHSAPALLDATGAAALREWLPFECSASRLQNYALNKSLRPATVPATLDDLYIEHALLTSGIRAMMAQANPDWQTTPPQPGVLITAGAALTGTGNPGYDALLALNATQPAGVTVLKADPHGLVPALGAIAASYPEMAVQLLDEENLVPLGTCFSVSGVPRRDRVAVRVKITLASNGKVKQATVDGGHLWTFPLPATETARVDIRCVRGLNIGGRSRHKLTISGGAAGIIIDARGRPLLTGADAETRSRNLPLWVAEMTGTTPQAIPPSWLEPVDEPESEAAEVEPVGPKKAQDKAESRKGRRKKKDEQPSSPFTDDELDDLLDDDDELKELRNVLP